MSAFLCSGLHIDTLASYASTHDVYIYHDDRRYPSKGQAAWMAGVLYTANVEAVNTLYCADDDSGTYEYTPGAKLPDEATILKLCDSYDYQACELDEYAETLACTIVKAIRLKAISNLPGYEDAPWTI